MTLKNNRTPLPCNFKLCASFRSHWWIQTGVIVRKPLIWVKIDDFFSRVTLQFDEWPWKTIGHLFHTTSSFVHHFVAISEFKLELQSGNVQFGSNSTIFRAVGPWNLTDDLENSRVPLLCYLCHFKLCSSFCSPWWIQTGVTVRKRPIWVKFDDFLTSVTLTFDFWPWLFAWTSLLSLVITPKFLWWYDDGNIVKKVWQTDRRTDGRTELFIELLGRS